MKYYEFMFILRSELEDTVRTETISRINELLEKNSFTKAKEEHIGIQRLSYEILKQKSGDYYLYFVTTEGTESVKEISKNLNITPNILRYIFIKKEGFKFEAEA
ncbi:MAG: 30S ribosomal protein S6 [Candidatus Muirbacterium halophilum]|nr:30S ribosomal protein S6 [Candidatus Muirbacterium halophilum]MCK9474713.1 30S ribosomal protein S6 [Candidatus Muirbacterium halophilum]